MPKVSEELLSLKTRRLGPKLSEALTRVLWRPSHGQQYRPAAGPTQAAVGGLSQGKRPVPPPACPHPSVAGRRADLADDQPRAVLLDRHHRPLEGPLRAGRPGRGAGPAAGPRPA